MGRSLLGATAHGRAADDIVASGATVVQLADGFKFTEGPACDAEGNVLFTDQPNDRILKWSVDGKLSTFKQPCGRSNGLCFDKDGNLWACADEKNELWCIRPDGTVDVVVKDYDGKLLNGPNDLWIRPDGGIYFSDPFYNATTGTAVRASRTSRASTSVRPIARSWSVSPTTCEQPNGVIGTPDGKTLYVADIRAEEDLRLRHPGGRHPAEQTAVLRDGLRRHDDRQRRQRLSDRPRCDGLRPAGQADQADSDRAGWTANVCFGGKDRQTLFITAQKQLFGLRMRVHGVGSQ